MKKWIYFFMGVTLWEVIARSGLIPIYQLPAPSLILAAFDTKIALSTLATAARTIGGFCGGVILAYAVAYLAFLAGKLKEMDTQFSGARAVPFLAAAPLFILWFGIGESSRLLVVILSVAAFVAGPLAENIRAIPREWTIQRQRYARSKHWEFTEVVIPGTLGPMIGPLRVSLAIGLTVAIAGDFLGSTVGIGRLIDSAKVTFNTPTIFLLIIVASLLGIAMDAALSRLLRKWGHWIGRTAKV